MTDQKPDAPPPERSTKHARPRSFLGDLFQPLTRTVDKTFDLAETVIHEGMETIADPYRLIDAADLGVKGTRSLGKLLLTPPDHKTAFKGGCSGTKRAAWSTVLKLDAVKAVGKNYDATVNDVLLTAVSGAVRRYLLKRGEEVDGHNIRAMVPYNLRPPDEPFEKLGNKFGLVILSLPIGIENPFRRLRVLKKRMDDIKNMPEAYIAFGILGGMGWSPRQIEHLVVDIFTSKVSAVMTNVPGPRETLYLAGSPLQSLMFWVPTGGDLSLGVSILSYAGDIVLGIMTDAARCPDPGSIISAFQLEFEEMARRGRVGQAQARARVQPQLKPHAQPSPQAKARCKALTQSGAQCKNRALPGTTTCARHARQKVKEHA
jgi:WS/DGAT/MGAT family acyltransferase